MPERVDQDEHLLAVSGASGLLGNVSCCFCLQVLVDACWSLSYLCEPPERINFLIATGALPRLTVLLGHASPNVQTPALRCIGNVRLEPPTRRECVCTEPALFAPSVSGRWPQGAPSRRKRCWLATLLLLLGSSRSCGRSSPMEVGRLGTASCLAQCALHLAGSSSQARKI